MLNLEKKIKLLLLSILAIIAAILIFILINSVISKPVIETFNELKIPRMTLNLTDSKSIEAENKIKAVETEFEYKIIGFIAGDEIEFEYKIIGFIAGDLDSSVVVKKGNKEQVVVKGAKLDGKYTLMSVSRDEIIFQTDTEVFKIKNEVGR